MWHKIIKLQRKAIHMIRLSKYNAHTEPIFRSLKFLKESDILPIQEKFFLINLLY